MLNFPIVCKALGLLLYLEALLFAICFVTGFYFAEANHLTFGIPAIVTLLLAFVLRAIGRHSDNRLNRRDGFLIVALSWVVFSLIGTLPFLIDGCLSRPTEALFETVSGFTTTGATCLTAIDHLPPSILLWRSLTHWIGGLGIVFFTIVLLPNMGSSDFKLFAAESTGLKVGKLHPRISTSARWLWSCYALLTIGCIVAYYLAGMSFWDALNHGLSTISTGGFSTHSESIGYFHSPLIQWVATVFMLLAATNFTLLYLLLFKWRFRDVLCDDELGGYIRLYLGSTCIIALILMVMGGLSAGDAFSKAFFNVATLMTTTGFTVDDFMTWHPATLPFIMCCMFFCGCSGSTSGGIKCVRLVMLVKLIRSEFRQVLHPHAVIPMRIRHSLITPHMGRTLLVFLTMAVTLIAGGTTLMVLTGLPMLDAFGLSLSAFCNVGPAPGHVVGAMGSWNVLTDFQLLLSSFLMLAGRLEVFSLFLPFMPAFWHDK